MLTKKEVITIFTLLFLAVLFFVKISLPFTMAISIIPGWHTTALSNDYESVIIDFGFAIALMQLIILIGHKVSFIKDFCTKNVISVGNIMLLIPFLTLLPFLFISWLAGTIWESYAFYERLYQLSNTMINLKIAAFTMPFLLVFRRIRNHYWLNLGIVLAVIFGYFI